MIDWLLELNHWHWLALGLALLAAELLGTAGYCLWLGVSALLVSAILLVVPVSWQLQWSSFAAFSLITTWLWWRRQLSNDKRSDAGRTLNQKQKQLIGQTAVVRDDVDAGQFRLALGDTTWLAECQEPLHAGQRVTVVDVDGTILIVEPKKIS
ncbi:NfeD family protein [Vibrio fluvialis]|nr:NfeD family protein [Vibrio fluvialis]